MTKTARALSLLAGALTMTLIPCLPALAASESCRMPGCETSQEQALTAPDCCCSVANAPALSTAPATVLAQVKWVAASISVTTVEAATVSSSVAREISVQPPGHVPLFLLHSSLLI